MNCKSINSKFMLYSFLFLLFFDRFSATHCPACKISPTNQFCQTEWRFKMIYKKITTEIRLFKNKCNLPSNNHGFLQLNFINFIYFTCRHFT